MKSKFRLSDNVGLLFTAGLFAIIVWVFAKSGQTTEARFVVPVIATNVDSRMQVEIEPSEIPVVVRYSKSMAGSITSENFRFEVDTSDMRDGLGVSFKSKTLPLTERNWVESNPSTSVRLIKIGQLANTVEVRLRWNGVPAVVDPDIVGLDRVPDGYQVVMPVKVNPREVYLIGKSEIINTLPKDEATSRHIVVTEPISVAGKTQGSLETVPLHIPQGLTLLQQRQGDLVEVNLEIQEVQTVREIREVPLDFKAVASDSVSLSYSPKSAVVRVFGPQSLIRQLTKDSFRMSLVRPPEELPGTTRELPVEANFASTIPDDIRTRVSIRSVEPKTVNVSYDDIETTATQ